MHSRDNRHCDVQMLPKPQYYQRPTLQNMGFNYKVCWPTSCIGNSNQTDSRTFQITHMEETTIMLYSMALLWPTTTEPFQNNRARSVPLVDVPCGSCGWFLIRKPTKAGKRRFCPSNTFNARALLWARRHARLPQHNQTNEHNPPIHRQVMGDTPHREGLASVPPLRPKYTASVQRKPVMFHCSPKKSTSNAA